MPPKVAISEAAPYMLFPKGDSIDMAYVLGVMSSIPFDWQARRSVEINLSYYVMYALTIPRPDRENKLRGRIVEIVGRLTCVDSRFGEWAKQLNIKVVKPVEVLEKDRYLAELDALVALLYGLNKDQLKYVFENFHRGTILSSRMQQALVYFNDWSARL